MVKVSPVHVHEALICMQWCPQKGREYANLSMVAKFLTLPPCMLQKLGNLQGTAYWRESSWTWCRCKRKYSQCLLISEIGGDLWHEHFRTYLKEHYTQRREVNKCGNWSILVVFKFIFPISHPSSFLSFLASESFYKRNIIHKSNI